jgi:hypothetical protein
MTLEQYLNETQYAAANLLQLIWHEYNQLEKLEEELKKLQKVIQHQYRQSQYLMDSEDPDDIMLGAGKRWETYFEEDKEHFHKTEDFKQLQQQIQTHDFSIRTISSGLFHIAKQGLSTVYVNPENWPNGRAVGTQHLKNVILQARNQTMHYEEPKDCKKAVKDVFEKLSVEFNSIFGNYNRENLAFEVVKLLEWKDYQKFRDDMLTLT